MKHANRVSKNRERKRKLKKIIHAQHNFAEKLNKLKKMGYDDEFFRKAALLSIFLFVALSVLLCFGIVYCFCDAKSNLSLVYFLRNRLKIVLPDEELLIQQQKSKTKDNKDKKENKNDKLQQKNTTTQKQPVGQESKSKISTISDLESLAQKLQNEWSEPNFERNPSYAESSLATTQRAIKPVFSRKISRVSEFSNATGASSLAFYTIAESESQNRTPVVSAGIYLSPKKHSLLHLPGPPSISAPVQSNSISSTICPTSSQHEVSMSARKNGNYYQNNNQNLEFKNRRAAFKRNYSKDTILGTIRSGNNTPENEMDISSQMELSSNFVNSPKNSNNYGPHIHTTDLSGDQKCWEENENRCPKINGFYTFPSRYQNRNKKFLYSENLRSNLVELPAIIAPRLVIDYNNNQRFGRSKSQAGYITSSLDSSNYVTHHTKINNKNYSQPIILDLKALKSRTEINQSKKALNNVLNKVNRSSSKLNLKNKNLGAFTGRQERSVIGNQTAELLIRREK